VIPKMAVCRLCGIKPKREIVAWGFSDKDDELFLVHRCQGKIVRFPKRDTFSHLYVSGQEPLVVESWNALQEAPTGTKDGTSA
jgi:hypothetical protein